VVIVGRPNVGKSTLFNRLTGSRRALVHDRPGVTRDRIIGDGEGPGGRPVVIVDTGGLVLEDDGSDMVAGIRSQAEAAIREGDVVLLLLDGEAGPLPPDHDIAGYLRTLDVPVIPVVNKADRSAVALGASEFYSLGLGEPVPVSAEHGTGIDELWRAVEPHLGATEGEEPEEGTDASREIQVAIIGRPNVGKSSLLNRLVGAERTLVSEVPGTTRDAIDVVIEREGSRFRFVDTAGIRRKGRTDRGPEVLSVVMARRHLERAHLCLLLIDAVTGVTRQDAHIGGYAWEAGRAVVVVANKWDLVEDGAAARARLEDDLERQLKYLRHAPLVSVSAVTGRGVARLYSTMAGVFAAHSRQVPTSELNRVLHAAWQRRPPPAAGRSQPKLYYASQVHRAPPRFVLFTNLPRAPHFSYLRHVENVLRTAFGLDGVPIQVMIRGRTS
jgi:GTP-binding protein